MTLLQNDTELVKGRGWPLGFCGGSLLLNLFLHASISSWVPENIEFAGCNGRNSWSGGKGRLNTSTKWCALEKRAIGGRCLERKARPVDMREGSRYHHIMLPSHSQQLIAQQLLVRKPGASGQVDKVVPVNG